MDIKTIPAPAPTPQECSFCGADKISCDSKKATPLEHELLTFVEHSSKKRMNDKGSKP